MNKSIFQSAISVFVKDKLLAMTEEDNLCICVAF